MGRFRGCAAFLLLCLPLAAPADEAAAQADILTLFDEFVSAGAAASRCAAPTDEIAIHFLSNFQWVSAYATQEISRRSPQASNQEVAAALAERSQSVKRRTHELVRAEGCDSEPVQELVRRFLAQSLWKPESA